jgi:ABC-type nitrate/sulfonate/bicarbonate transport system substrate-binding protein
MSRWIAWLMILAGWLCLSPASMAAEPVRIALDWTPNTNHTGILVAQSKGFFAEEGLAVEVIEMGPGLGVHLVVSGQCEFAVSMQEEITMARAQGMPVVSVAALYPHNTSGFMAPAELGIESPRDFEGLRYGGWGQDFERAILRTVMEADGADPKSVQMVDLGMLDVPVALQRGFADIFWVYFGWQGVQAQLLDIEFTYLPLAQLAEALDYYTPLIATSEAMIADHPEIVARFLRALARGYVFAAREPEDAADALLSFAPELDRDLVLASQIWLSDHGVDDLERWGWQRQETWAAFSEWAHRHGLIETPLHAEDAYTNELLPREGPS